jgi:type II secretory pathway predicted ATPase ExeA
VLELFDNQGKTPCFILDEAHLMDHDTLQELILITNFQMDSKVPFILVLIGQPDLREKLKRRMHEPLNQRITLRYHMAGLSLEEARSYILHHLKIAGRTDPLFDEQAIEVIHQLSLVLPLTLQTPPPPR